MFINPNDFADFMAQQLWKQTLTSVLCYAITFRDRDDPDPTLDQMVEINKEVGERIQACYDRVRGNRPVDGLTSAGDRALIFEAVLKDALDILGVKVP